MSCFIAEVGDISRFDNPKQIQKLAGYAIVADSSGKHTGKNCISHRGRKRPRYALYEAAISAIARNNEFKEIHNYYRTREKNQEFVEKDAVCDSDSVQADPNYLYDTNEGYRL